MSTFALSNAWNKSACAFGSSLCASTNVCAVPASSAPTSVWLRTTTPVLPFTLSTVLACAPASIPSNLDLSAVVYDAVVASKIALLLWVCLAEVFAASADFSSSVKLLSDNTLYIVDEPVFNSLSTLLSNAACCAVEIGLFKSLVLSTLPRLSCSFVTPCGLLVLLMCELTDAANKSYTDCATLPFIAAHNDVASSKSVLAKTTTPV